MGRLLPVLEFAGRRYPIDWSLQDAENAKLRQGMGRGESSTWLAMALDRLGFPCRHAWPGSVPARPERRTPLATEFSSSATAFDMGGLHRDIDGQRPDMLGLRFDLLSHPIRRLWPPSSTCLAAAFDVLGHPGRHAWPPSSTWPHDTYMVVPPPGTPKTRPFLASPRLGGSRLRGPQNFFKTRSTAFCCVRVSAPTATMFNRSGRKTKAAASRTSSRVTARIFSCRSRGVLGRSARVARP